MGFAIVEMAIHSRVTPHRTAPALGAGYTQMNELKHDHHRFENPNGDNVHHRHPPYWKHAHRDLRWRIHVQPQQPVSDTIAK
jgi:hypothetical protein